MEANIEKNVYFCAQQSTKERQSMSKMRFFALQELANRRPLEVTTPSNKLSDYYGSHVFDRKKMQEYLPKEAYKAVVNAIEKGTPINREMADLIANGMKSMMAL